MRILFVPSLFLFLIGVGVPAASEIVRQGETTDIANDFILAVRYARQQAREQDRELTLCASTDGNRCSYSTDWSKGWIVIDHREQKVVNSWMTLPGRLGFLAEKSSIRFGRHGFGKRSDTRWIMFDKGCTTNGGSEGRRITVSAMGKTTVERTRCGEDTLTTNRIQQPIET